MKLPALPVCHLTCSFGNFFQMTVMGEVLTDELSDAGSTPARYTWVPCVEPLPENNDRGSKEHGLHKH